MTTPTPWKQYGTEILGGEGTPQARIILKLAQGHKSSAPLLELSSPEWDQAMEDAQLIITAVNNHQRLTEENRVLREVLSKIEDFARGQSDVGNIIANIAHEALSDPIPKGDL